MRAGWLLVVGSLWACTSKRGEEETASEAELPPLEPAVEAQVPFWTVIVPASVNDGPEGLFLIDSGAEQLRLASAAGGCEDTVSRLSWADLALTDVPCSGYDVELLSGLLGVELAGLLGRAQLESRAIGIDYAGAAVYPLASWPEATPLDDRVEGWFELPFLEASGHYLVVPARFEGQEEAVNVVIDTGTSSAVISESLFAALGAGEDGRAVLEGSSSVSGVTVDASPIVRLRGVEVGGATAELAWASVLSDRWFNQVSRATGLEIAAVLGGSFLREHLTVLDYPAGLLRLAPYASRAHVEDEFQAAGVEIIGLDGQTWIFTVFAGSDAEASGVLPGDALIALDGAPTAELSHAEMLAMIRGEPGTSLTLDLERQGEAIAVTVLREDLLPALAEE